MYRAFKTQYIALNCRNEKNWWLIPIMVSNRIDSECGYS